MQYDETLPQWKQFDYDIHLYGWDVVVGFTPAYFFTDIAQTHEEEQKNATTGKP